MGIFFEDAPGKRYPKSILLVVIQLFIIIGMLITLIYGIIQGFQPVFTGTASILLSLSMFLDAMHYQRNAKKWDKKGLIITSLFLISGITLVLSN